MNFCDQTARAGGNFSNHASVCVWWQQVLTTRSPRHVTFLSSNQWTVRPRGRHSSSGSVLAGGFYDLLWDYCDEAGTCVSWRDHCPVDWVAWCEIREHYSVTCNARHGAFQTRAEQAQCTLQARAYCDDSLASGHQRQLSSVLCYQDSHLLRIYRNSRSLSISLLLSIRNNGVTGVFSYQKGNNLTVSHRGLYILSLTSGTSLENWLYSA